MWTKALVNTCTTNQDPSQNKIDTHLLALEHFLCLRLVKPDRKFSTFSHVGVNVLSPLLGRHKLADVGLVVVAHVDNDSILFAHFCVVVLRLEVDTGLSDRRGLRPAQAIIDNLGNLKRMKLGKELAAGQVVSELELSLFEFIPISKCPQLAAPGANAIIRSSERAI